jgi:hypothetical protein
MSNVALLNLLIINKMFDLKNLIFFLIISSRKSNMHIRVYNYDILMTGEMQKHYIDNLRQSEFSYFCEKYEDECTEQNVLIK